MRKTFGFIEPKALGGGIFRVGVEGAFFGVWLNTHQWSYVTRTDRRVEGWLRRDGYQYIYCLPPAGVLHSQNKVTNAP